jgi:hypothetical protein
MESPMQLQRFRDFLEQLRVDLAKAQELRDRVLADIQAYEELESNVKLLQQARQGNWGRGGRGGPEASPAGLVKGAAALQDSDKASHARQRTVGLACRQAVRPAEQAPRPLHSPCPGAGGAVPAEHACAPGCGHARQGQGARHLAPAGGRGAGLPCGVQPGGGAGRGRRQAGAPAGAGSGAQPAGEARHQGPDPLLLVCPNALSVLTKEGAFWLRALVRGVNQLTWA